MNTERRERPILFKDDMIRAILEGRKTQTRRIVKPCKCKESLCELAPHEIAGEINRGHYRNCPYGKPGDRLWVRENFLQLMHGQVTDGRVKYCASIDPRSTGTPKNDGYWWRKRPSIHMPRWASRITLEITDVRVERLQDISIDDAKAEGSPTHGHSGAEISARKGFRHLWGRINGHESWDANPWVWVIEFKRISPEAAQ